MHAEIQQRDRSLQRRVAVLAGLGFAAALPMLLLLQANLRNPTANSADLLAQIHYAIAAIAIVALPMHWPVRWLWQLGRATVRTERFPPPDTRVVRDTPVLHAQAARRRGRALQAFAVLLSMTTLLVPLALSWVVAPLVAQLL